MIPCYNIFEQKVLIKKERNGNHTYSLSCKQSDCFNLQVLPERALGITEVYLNANGISKKFVWEGIVSGKDCFVINLNKILSPPHEYFDLILKSAEKEYFVNSSTGLFQDEYTSYTLSSGSEGKFLFTYEQNNAPALFNGCIYHIFVDRFNKKDPSIREDSNYEPDWDNGIPEYAERAGDFIKNNTHLGGNFQGITEKLDYLESLSVDCIYLSPVSKAYSNHKYDVGSYFDIDENFGGEENFKKLTEECHKRNISVILDSVFNHTGDNSKYFNKFSSYNSIGAYQSKKSEFYNWYTFTDYPENYDSWWGIKCMPAIKKGCSEFMDYICAKNGVIDFYMNLGADGLRLDVADELTLEFIKRIKSAVIRNKPDGLVIGEVWENAARKTAYNEDKFYFDENKLDSVTNYPLMNAILEFVGSGNCESLRRVMAEIYTDYPEQNILRLMNVISTHDTIRAISRFVTPPSTKREKSVYKMNDSDYIKSAEKIKVAVALQSFLPGIPCIYYGDEIGMQGFEDPFNRMPMTWNKIHFPLFEHYRKILSIRKNNRPLWKGGLKVKKIDSGIIVFDRFCENETVRVFINITDKEERFEVNGTNLYNGQKTKLLILPPNTCYPVKILT